MPAPDFPFIILDNVDSTNNYAMGKVHTGITKHGDAYFSSNQNSGKGQRGRDWISGQGENIALTVVIEPHRFKMTNQFCLSMSVAMACFDFFNKYAGDETKIKWPNDIYWRDRKAGGILIENVFRGNHWNWAVTGVGININQIAFDPELKNPVSLKQITGKTFDLVLLAKELHLHIMKRISIENDHLLEEYNNGLYKRNEVVRLKEQNRLFETQIKGVNNEGQLITFGTDEELFSFGDVEWMI